MMLFQDAVVVRPHGSIELDPLHPYHGQMMIINELPCVRRLVNPHEKEREDNCSEVSR